MAPPPPALVEYWPEAGVPVVVFQVLKVRSIPAISKWTREIGSKASLAMMSGARLGIVCTLVWLSSWVAANPVNAEGSTVVEPPLDPPMY